MYTQCPECSVAFRVTAEVLKMAAGKVRCGGCGVAFNALEHLSETKPSAPPPKEEPVDPDLPELQPEPPGELEADTPPESISAEQSAALLKTLDQLAGEDIRIEDTGVEWRVIDDNEPDDEPQPDEQEPGEQEPATADEPSRTIDQMLFDDNTVLPDDFDDVVEVPAQPRVEEPPLEPEPEAPQFDLDLSEPDEWDDLLGDLDEAPAAAVEQAEAVTEAEFAPEQEPLAEAEPRGGPDELLDVDTQFELQAEALGIDLSGIHEAPEEETPAELELEPEPETPPEPAPEPEPEPEPQPKQQPDDETSIDEDLIAAAFESEAAAKSLEATASEEPLELEDEELEAALPEAIDEDLELEVDLQVDDEPQAEDDIEDIAMGFDDNVERDIETLSMSLDDEADEAVAAAAEEPVVAEMSEEEKTINMMIDQELLNIAVEDEDGFASTIVQLQPDDDPLDKDAVQHDDSEAADQSQQAEQSEPAVKGHPAPPELAVETIIMEGDRIRGELGVEQVADDEPADTGESPGVALPLHRDKDDYERRREMTRAPAGAGTWAAIVALVLLLGVQVIHQSREALATVPALNSAIAPVYRMLGRPLTPQWNISGWRFEATKGDTDEAGEQLTIYSRVGNNSEQALPYPLVHVSLTDRFEDIIGSAILDPVDYLPENADPRKPVPPGSSFNAVITIASPSPEATGFKLNVCYRLAGGQLRCADHDFK